MRRVYRKRLARDEPVKKHANGGQVLLHRRLRTRRSEFFDLSGDVDWLHPFQREFATQAPIGKLRDRDEVRVARIAVPEFGPWNIPRSAYCLQVTLGTLGACCSRHQPKAIPVGGAELVRDQNFGGVKFLG